MNITYVSALYNIYHSENISNRLYKDVQDLITQPIKLILFVDDFYFPMIKAIENSHPNGSLTIIHLPIENLTIYNLIIKNKEKLHLPEYRSQEKDTHEYMALMNTKIEFLYKASKLCPTEIYISWIDAGIAKLFYDKSTSFNRLCNLEIQNVEKILIPGSYTIPVDFGRLITRIWWVFLGSFFICNGDFVTDFYNYSIEAVNKFMDYNYITWEVNVWIYILSKYPKIFIWYYSDHNDGLSIIPKEYIRTIVPEINYPLN